MGGGGRGSPFLSPINLRLAPVNQQDYRNLRTPASHASPPQKFLARSGGQRTGLEQPPPPPPPAQSHGIFTTHRQGMGVRA